MNDSASRHDGLADESLAALQAAWGAIGHESLAVGATLSGTGLPSVSARSATGDTVRTAVLPLAGSPIAHAELHCLAVLQRGASLPDDLTLWTTHSACPMCGAAARFVGVRSMKHLSEDPFAAELGPGRRVERADGQWGFFADVLLSLSVLALSRPSGKAEILRTRRPAPFERALRDVPDVLAGRYTFAEYLHAVVDRRPGGT